MQEERKKEELIAEEGKVPHPSSLNEGKVSFFKDKKKVRFLVSLIAAAIVLTFLGLSFSYLSIMVAAIIFVASVAVIALAIVSIFKDWETVCKLSITALYIGAIFLITYFALSKSGLLASIDSADDVVNYINNSGGVAELIFVLANFLQVTVIPIPSTITTTAGAILFDGIWKPLYLTVIGLVAGSMFAFFLGKVFGVRFANWLVGEKTIRKYKAMTKGRDKVVLFYMFVFPFFPDDFLCILAGMTNYTYLGFFLLQIFSRTLGTLTTILITKGIVSIPMHGLWLALWAVIIILVIVLLILTIKYSEKIEIVFMRLIDKLTFGYANRRRRMREIAAAEKAAHASKERPDNPAPDRSEEVPPEDASEQGEEHYDSV